MIGRARQTAKWVTAYNAFQATLSDLMPLQLLPFNNAAASEFLRLKSALRQIGTQDLRIAAIVLSVGGILVTRNQRDFARVPDLVVADWTQP